MWGKTILTSLLFGKSKYNLYLSKDLYEEVTPKMPYTITKIKTRYLTSQAKLFFVAVIVNRYFFY